MLRDFFLPNFKNGVIHIPWLWLAVAALIVVLACF